MRKSIQSVTRSLAFSAATAAASDFKTSDIHWGVPSPITAHLGVAFEVAGGTGANGSLKFPFRIGRNDGSLTYAVQVEFQTEHLKFTTHCTFRNKTDDIVADLSTALAAKGEPIGNGYVIVETQNKKTEKAGKPCVTEVTDGTYLLMKNNDALRLYVDANDFMDLSPVK